MARPLRVEFEGALYHLTARGNERRAVFRGEADCARFLALLASSLARFEVTLHAFALMGNHFHLLAQTRRANLSRWMHWLLTAYTVDFNARHRRRGHGHLFQGRFKSILVEADGYLLSLSRYIHLNPVRGRVLGQGDLTARRARLRAYPWSSYAGYAGLRRAHPVVTESMVLGEMSNSLPAGAPQATCRRAYRRFVEEGLIEPQPSPLQEAQAQAVLGGERFVQRVRDWLAEQQAGDPTRTRAQEEESTAARRLRRTAPPTGTTRAISRPAQEIIRRIARACGVTVESLAGAGARGRWLPARGAAMTLVHELCAPSYRQVGELFGRVNYAAVAQRIRRTRALDEAGRLPVSLAELRTKCQNV